MNIAGVLQQAAEETWCCWHKTSFASWHHQRHGITSWPGDIYPRLRHHIVRWRSNDWFFISST